MGRLSGEIDIKDLSSWDVWYYSRNHNIRLELLLDDLLNKLGLKVEDGALVDKAEDD